VWRADIHPRRVGPNQDFGCGHVGVNIALAPAGHPRAPEPGAQRPKAARMRAKWCQLCLTA
jgi:hypothetical protein